MAKRPLVIVCIAYILGIILHDNITGLLFSMLLIVCSVVFLIIYKNQNIMLKIIIIIALGIGFFYSNYKQSISISNVAKFENKIVNLEGTFLEKIKQEEGYYSFTVKVNKVEDNLIENETSKVNYYSKNIVNYNYGDLIKINGVIKVPDGMRNPGGFNYRKYLLTQDIYTIITAKSVDILKPSGGNYSSIKKYSFLFKERIISIIRSSLPEKESGLLEGIILSQKEFLDETIKTDFQNSGLSHLMSVSGLHVGYVVGFLLFILKRLNIKNLLSNILLTIILIIFIIITGSSPSVIRACIMSLLIIYARALRRNSDVLTSLSFAALILLIYNPMILYNVGFQLSFGATLSIIVLYPKVKKLLNFIPKYIRDLLAVTLSVQIGILPISIYYFNSVSVISIITNILAVPLAGIIVILGLCMIILGLFHIFFAKFVGVFLYYLLALLMWIASLGSTISFSTITLSTPSIISIAIYYVLLFTLIYKYKSAKERLNIKLVYKVGFVLVIALIITNLYKRPLEISCIDVGQGDAIFIRTPSNKVAMIDVGGFSNDRNNAGESVIVPFLLDKRIRKIDIMFISHTDKDHICGLNEIINKCKVDKIVLSARIKNDKLFELLKRENIKIINIKNSGKVELDKDIILELFATSAVYNNINDDESLIVGLNYKKRNFLFTGDSSVNLEKEMLDKFKANYDVLKLGHHGSKTSTSSELLDKINPKIALISVGRNNTFKHPSKSVIDRLNDKSITTFRTDNNGCISVFSNGDYIKVKTMIGDK